MYLRKLVTYASTSILKKNVLKSKRCAEIKTSSSIIQHNFDTLFTIAFMRRLRIGNSNEILVFRKCPFTLPLGISRFFAQTCLFPWHYRKFYHINSFPTPWRKIEIWRLENSNMHQKETTAAKKPSYCRNNHLRWLERLEIIEL